MKQVMTIRVEAELLARAHEQAELENRTLTNFIETVLKERLEESDPPPKRKR
ncbi:hypothetical protein AAFG13_06805 [Bradyrhizobium sp. B124]|uniref:hypothetical protein n=1 Tax=Bradyrhizobium sp. B124 TaxID=3140245 RepID=UPI003183C390